MRVRVSLSRWQGWRGRSVAQKTTQKKKQEIEGGCFFVFSKNMLQHDKLSPDQISLHVPSDAIRRRQLLHIVLCTKITADLGFFFLPPPPQNQTYQCGEKKKKIGIMKYCITTVPRGVLSQRPIPFLYSTEHAQCALPSSPCSWPPKTTLSICMASPGMTQQQVTQHAHTLHTLPLAVSLWGRGGGAQTPLFPWSSSAPGPPVVKTC